ncbi:WD domain, G-beta repeat [Rubripirellula lacrimiformis]|uniref:WD domain, G-beta repeat n=1 Tax=Rubripirellula lacrimiformis TaxID=1930273 RepID=A0A517NHS0_9BACT|nr:SHD1 domain-containing protein [Rubripirellula lacrimiformis]QDT06681.1 WD domain, G-beta repeat [Rubripirellula lacrimiformis]
MRTVLLLLFAAMWPCSAANAREWVDATGQFRIEAKLVVLHGAKVVLEKIDGSIISIPVAKLSQSDQAFLKTRPKAVGTAAPTAGGGNTALGPSPALSVGHDEIALASDTERILRKACYRCHGEDGTSEGGFNFVVNLGKLAKTIAKPGEDSLLIERITADDDSVMPPVGEDPRLTAAEMTTIQKWFAAGSPAVVTESERAFLTNEQVVAFIDADIQKQHERSQRFIRYFTLTHLYNAGVSEDELQTYRNAFAKLLNSLSWNADLIMPKAIDPARTIFRLDMREVHWDQSIWETIEQANPYFLRLSSANAKSCFERAETEMPYVRIDWFVHAASKPPLYHSVLAMPTTDADLEDMLRVNVQSNIEQETAIRAAFNRSGVSQNNRLIEWHKSPYGSYWKSYDFGGNTGHQNLFQYPLGPDNGADSFRHDGGEIIFTLPNGLQGYLLTDANGNRIDQGPTQIVSDPKRADRTVTNGVSCMSCHYAGVIPKKDEIGTAVRGNRSAFQDADDILALYRESDELDRIIQRDGRRFSAVLDRLGITSLSRSGESISAMSVRFVQDIDLQQVACEFGLQPDDFLKRLENATRVARIFSPLQVAGGTIKRDVFKDMFAEACIDLRLSDDDNLTASRQYLNRPETARRSLRPDSMPAADRGRATLNRTRSRTSSPGRQSVPKLRQTARFSDLSWGVKSLAFDPRHSFVVAGRPDRKITLFDFANGSVVQEFEKLELLQSVTCCAYSPDGSQMLAGGNTGHIAIFSVARDGRLEPSGQFAGHSKEIKCMAISSDGRHAMTGGSEKKSRYWEIRTGQEIGLVTGFEGAVKAVHISRDGRTLLATDGGVLIEYDIRSGKVNSQRPLTRSWASGQAAAFSKDGSWLAVGDTYNIRIWDLETFRELPPLIGKEISWTMQFSPDGKYLLSGGRAKVELWDFQRQSRLFQYAIGSGYVQVLDVSPDGQDIAAVGTIGSDLEVIRLDD